MTDKANTECPLPFYGGGIKTVTCGGNFHEFLPSVKMIHLFIWIIFLNDLTKHEKAYITRTKTDSWRDCCCALFSKYLSHFQFHMRHTVWSLIILAIFFSGLGWGGGGGMVCTQDCCGSLGQTTIFASYCTFEDM